MPKYMNLGGNSGVRAYEFGDSYIRVQFHDWLIYEYTNQSAGVANVEQMKRLAVAGRGLNSYISRVVRKGYASKKKGFLPL